MLKRIESNNGCIGSGSETIVSIMLCIFVHRSTYNNNIRQCKQQLVEQHFIYLDIVKCDKIRYFHIGVPQKMNACTFVFLYLWLCVYVCMGALLKPTKRKKSQHSTERMERMHCVCSSRKKNQNAMAYRQAVRHLHDTHFLTTMFQCSNPTTASMCGVMERKGSKKGNKRRRRRRNKIVSWNWKAACVLKTRKLYELFRFQTQKIPECSDLCCDSTKPAPNSKNFLETSIFRQLRMDLFFISWTFFRKTQFFPFLRVEISDFIFDDIIIAV